MSKLTPPGPPGLRYRASLAVYAGLMRLGMPLVWRYFRRRAERDRRYGAFPEERRGAGASFAADVWVHAVSLGEMKSAEPLVRSLLTDGYRVVTTHATPAGRGIAEASFAGEIASGQMAVRYMPIDVAKYWRAFLGSTRPKIGLVMEMEFWPVMMEVARGAGLPLVLANSQVPEKSFARARLVRWLLGGHPSARAALVLAKSERMASRFRELGAETVEVAGETRFDIPPPSEQVAKGTAFGEVLGHRPVLALASVVAGEEDTYVAALRELANEGVTPYVIWVPRAPELFDATVERLSDAGFRVARRSTSLSDRLEMMGQASEADILVGDSMGEMFFYLAAADAVIVGGGFVEKGAHNIIEPLALGKPVVTGPHVWTIEFPGVEAREAGVLRVCDDPGALAQVLREVLGTGGGAAEAFHRAHLGASKRILERIRPVLGEGRE